MRFYATRVTSTTGYLRCLFNSRKMPRYVLGQRHLANIIDKDQARLFSDSALSAQWALPQVIFICCNDFIK